MQQQSHQIPIELLVKAYFHYTPNKDAAIAAMVLYAIISVAITGITLRTRCYYMMTVAITGFLELAGFATRIYMLSQPSLNVYIIHQALLIISPVLLAIVEYVTVSRLISLAGTNKESKTTNNRFSRGVSWCFTVSDIICLLMQSTGGAMYANPSTVAMARTLLLAGLGAQLGFFGIFCVVTLHVQLSDRFGYKGNKQYRWVFLCLYTTIVLMYIRNIFRVVEFAMGYDGYLATNELFLYVFDFAPIYACFLCFASMHYGFWLGRAGVSRTGSLPRTVSQAWAMINGEKQAVAAAAVAKAGAAVPYAVGLPSKPVIHVHMQ